ncbi:sensor histidine kinase [Streptomyces sp. NPDC056821]|uniref:sensor histidine kinase n=1 Tax=unclassified Streptomyces TaxID=2593676 RepID=UPI0036BC2D6F
MRLLTRPRAVDARRRADLMITAALLGWALADVPWPWRPPGHGGSAVAVCGFLALGLAQSVPSLWRRRLPGTGLALTCTALAVRVGLGLHPVSALAALGATGYAFGAYSALPHRYARPLLAAATLTALAAAVNYQLRAAVGLPGVLLAAGVLAGDAAASRRRAAAAEVEAAHVAERTSIARELHDVLAHQLSAITVRAGAARMAMSNADGPEPPNAAALEVLTGIEDLAREALTELGRLLGALRRESPHSAHRRPVPCLAEVPSLVSAARAAGTAVELAVTGRPRPLSPGAELSAYRIVQEALTNVAKHAPGSTANVSLRFLPEALHIAVINTPPPTPTSHRSPAAGGRGMLGMRERAELHGGRLTTAMPLDGGFAVRAELPYGPPGGTP